jgi:hypothetical protein
MVPLAPALVCALMPMGCGFLQPSVSFHGDLIDLRNCVPERFVEGRLVVHGQTLALRDDKGAFTPLIWPTSYGLRWAPALVGGRYEVLDETGSVLAATGLRYRIGGSDFIAAGAFWACADVTPI